jgi:hypothetical protein
MPSTIHLEKDKQQKQIVRPPLIPRTMPGEWGIQKGSTITSTVPADWGVKKKSTTPTKRPMFTIDWL